MIPGNPIPSRAAKPEIPNPAGGGTTPAAASAFGKPNGPGSLPDAHFRIDEHERRLGAIEQGMHPDHVAAIAHGAVSALHVTMQAETEKLLKAVREDVDTDKAVVKAIGELVAAINRLVDARV